MADLLRDGVTWLGGARTACASSPVIYRRGAVEATVNATSARTVYEITDDYGFRMETWATDFLVLKADMIAAVGYPQIGDQIVADGKTYEVLDLAGQGPWRWADGFMVTMRIHTKQMG